MELMESVQAGVICDLSTNQAISRWYAFVVFVFSIIIILVILCKVVLNCCRMSKKRTHASYSSASSYDYHSMD